MKPYPLFTLNHLTVPETFSAEKKNLAVQNNQLLGFLGV